MIVNQKLAQSKGHVLTDLWETPDYIFHPLNNKYHFTLDPCCIPSNAKAMNFFTAKEDGLNQSWKGHRVFCNPPYSRGNIENWVFKCYYESIVMMDCQVVALLPVSTSSKWFHDFVWNKCEIEFIKGRIKFVGAPHAAPFSSMLAIYNFL